MVLDNRCGTGENTGFLSILFNILSFIVLHDSEKIHGAKHPNWTFALDIGLLRVGGTLVGKKKQEVLVICSKSLRYLLQFNITNYIKCSCTGIVSVI